MTKTTKIIYEGNPFYFGSDSPDQIGYFVADAIETLRQMGDPWNRPTIRVIVEITPPLRPERG